LLVRFREEVQALPRRVVPRIVVLLVVALGCFAALGGAYDEDPLAALDREVAEWVASSMPAWAEWLARPFSWLGGIGLLPLSVGLVALLLARRRVFEAAWVAGALAAIHIVTPLLKNVFDRPRPTQGSAVPLPASDAFPSGHASGAVVTCGVLAVLAAERWPERSRQLWGGAVILMLGIGASRVVLNVHYVSDVVAGWCLGVAVLAAALLLREHRRYASTDGRDAAEPRRTARGDRDPARLGP
jgi:membrane-associated phospholipid phosphatase